MPKDKRTELKLLKRAFWSRVRKLKATLDSSGEVQTAGKLTHIPVSSVTDRREVEKSTTRPNARYRVNELLKLISSEVGTTQVIRERRTGPKQRLHQSSTRSRQSRSRELGPTSTLLEW
jgi:hypothetical protein